MELHWNAQGSDIRSGSLFAVLAALARGEAEGFPALRPHQREPWHAFCVQVAASALLNAGRTDLPENEAAWRDLLLALTPEWPDGEAWELVVDDWMKPALLQPPLVRPEDAADYKSHIETPDALDLLVTAKNHDLKTGRMVSARDEHWVFALVTLQTYAAYGGARTYGIARMNGKTGSRMSLGVRPARGTAAAFRRDVRVLTTLPEQSPHGIRLLWTIPWDGKTSVAFERLSVPLFVEVARRLRITRERSSLFVRYATSNEPRVSAEALQGRTGDPWAPMIEDKNGWRSVTPKGQPFSYRRIPDLIADGRPVLANAYDSDDVQGLSLVGTTLVRRGGTDFTTEGFHHRRIPISPVVWRRGVFPREEILDRAGHIGRRRAEAAGAAGRILRRALFDLCQGGPDKARLDDDSAARKVERWTAAYDRDVDADFFDSAFWSEVAGEEGPHRKAWHERLARLARKQFWLAAPAAPRTQMRRIRAVVRSEAMLEGGLHRFVREAAGG